jgi:2-amino-4-hydroxy-6-hydroxymethyldihydropteridine diphosphokinase
VFLSLGSNDGVRLRSLRSAVRQLRRLPRSRLARLSSLYESSPVGAPGPDFLNAAAEIRTKLSPMGLLVELKRIEAALGRRPSRRWSPRSVDLDIALWGRRKLRTVFLTIPHPRATARRFVVEPLSELGAALRPAAAGRAAGQALRLVRAAGWAGLLALAAVPSRAIPAPVEQGVWVFDAHFPFRLQTDYERLDVRYQSLAYRALWRIPDTRTLNVVVEPTVGFFSEPVGAAYGGSGLLLNWQPLSGRVRPFIEGGGGIFLVDHYPRLDGPLNFELLLGGGVNIMLDQRFAATLGYRAHHWSNGGIYHPNVGINAHMPFIGLTWYR